MAFELKWSDKSTATDLSNALKISSQEPVITEEPLENRRSIGNPKSHSASIVCQDVHRQNLREVKKQNIWV